MFPDVWRQHLYLSLVIDTWFLDWGGKGKGMSPKGSCWVGSWQQYTVCVMERTCSSHLKELCQVRVARK